MGAYLCYGCATVLRSDMLRCPTCAVRVPAGGWPRDELIGNHVLAGQYRVVRRLGAGGFGVVYEVETTLGGLRRALKLLDVRWSYNLDIEERFVGEAQALDQLDHPNIARCFTIGRMDEAPLLYLLLEYVEGPSLAQLVEREPTGMSLERVLRLTRQIASALRAAHAVPLLHRDLKPENILVKAGGTANEQIKLIDFGLAKRLMPQRSDNATAGIHGTPEFMAPSSSCPARRSMRGSISGSSAR